MLSCTHAQLLPCLSLLLACLSFHLSPHPLFSRFTTMVSELLLPPVFPFSPSIFPFCNNRVRVTAPPPPPPSPSIFPFCNNGVRAFSLFATMVLELFPFLQQWCQSFFPFCNNGVRAFSLFTTMVSELFTPPPPPPPLVSDPLFSRFASVMSESPPPPPIFLFCISGT